jgi:hypothetical protein
MTNQINTLEEFMRRHAFLMFRLGRPTTLEPCVDTGAEARDSFYRLHNEFERVDNLYREFQRNYSSREGPIHINESRDLFNPLEQIMETYLGDIEEFFTPLNIAADRISARRSRPIDARGAYHLLHSGSPEDRRARQAYEERLAPMLSQLREGQEENYEVSMTGSTLPGELWRLHIQPENFFGGLTGVLRLESIAPYVNDNITAFEYVRVYESAGRHENGCFVTSRFGENAAEELRAEYPETHVVEVVNPSLQSFRSLLPSELSSVFQGFDTHQDLRERMRSLPGQTLFGPYLDQAYENGWRRDLLTA